MRVSRHATEMATSSNVLLPMEPPAPRKSIPGLGAIFLVVFLDILGFSLVLPFLAEEARDTFHTTAFVGTLLGAVYSLMQFLFVPVWGRMSDRIGRRPVLVWSVLATALGMINLGCGLLFASGIAWLFVARVISGIATANLGTASAYIADVTRPEERARGMGMLGMAFGLGFIIGPAVGGALSSIEILGRRGAVPCFVAAGLSFVNLAWVFFRLPESLPPERRNTTATRSLAPLNIAAARDAFARPGVALAVLVNFVLVLSFTVLDQTFRFFTADNFGMAPLATGLVLCFVGVVAAFVQGGVIRPLAKRFDESKLVVWGTAIQALAFASLAASPAFGVSALYVAAGLLAVGNGLTQPSISAYVSKRADPTAQGATLGTNQSAASLARVFGPALGGWLYGAAGSRSPYVASAVGMVLATLVALALRPSTDQRNTSTQTS
ncbi:MAG: tetracycline resistance protein [Labilithrix sp.]|nr:tetracycline resistance protein [Labilithrix sp.]